VIDVPAALRAVPHFDTFCSVERLQSFVESLPANSGDFKVEMLGRSGNGIPIHHIRYGRGSLKALFVAFPHPNEAVGGLTALSLLTLLRQGNRALVDADVEWHIVPCIDPDGAKLNEGWSQTPFSLDNYLRHFHRQENRDQVEYSFPINHKRLVFDRPTREAALLKALIAKVMPDFYYSLHNSAGAGGAYYLLSRAIPEKYHLKLYQLLDQYRVPLQLNLPYQDWVAQFGRGVFEILSTSKWYDCQEQTAASPEEILQTGATSWEYLAQIKGSALTLLAELPYVQHPSDGSTEPTAQNLRELKLRVDADNKFIATVVLEEWEKVKEALDATSPFYTKIVNGVISQKEKLHEGLPSWPSKTRDLLFNPSYGRIGTEGERFNVYFLERFFVLCHTYEFVRLLKVSTQTAAVRRATDRLEALFDEALARLDREIGFDRFEVINCDRLARVQLGSGLIVLNSMLESDGALL
jgi:hypothetical protein